MTGRWLLLAALGAAACAPAAMQQPAGAPASPGKIGGARPAKAPSPGRPADERAAALMPLLEAPWGWRDDKDGQLRAPLPDWERWTRVRFWGVEHFTGFRYGDDHRALAIVLVQEVPEGTPTDSRSCMRRFEAWARPKAKAFGVELGPIGQRDARWQDDALSVEYVDGAVDFMFEHREFSAAWATFPAYPDACLVYAVAVPWRGHAELARQIRDRWVDEGFGGLRAMTQRAPHRLP